MPFLTGIFVIFAAYLFGSIPFGVIIVWLKTGKDVRKIESGRTGGSNVMRAAGFWSGLITGALDVVKGLLSALVATVIMPDYPWVHVLSPIAAVLGHNYSIFLLERTELGKLKFRGGAGGATTIGGAAGLWFPVLIFLLPVLLCIWLVIGYASLATLSTGILVALVFAYRAWIGAGPWEYIFYGILVEVILIWGLRPNIKRLFTGTERIVGLRVWLKSRKEKSSD
jgi:glycerol-3-phosphate acyltransferase PlsY